MSPIDRELLARALEAEAGNQGPEGMLAAGSVIMNRTKTPGYGGDLRGVILKPGQFSAFNSITGYAGGEQGQDMANIRVSDNAYQVADALLSGNYKDPTGGATHFYNPRISNPSWGEDAGGNWTKIGDHVFGRADAGKSGQPIEVKKLPSINSFVPNATANDAGPSQNRQAQTGLLTGGAAQNMMGGGEAMQAEEPGKGFFNNDKYKDMAAVLAQGFAAMGSNPALQKFASQVAGQRTEAQARNKTIEFLRKSGRDDLADAVESGSLGARDAAQVLFAQPKATAKEAQIQRLINTGVPKDIAIGIADGRLVVSRDPITGKATIVDKAGLMFEAAGEPIAAPDTPDAGTGQEFLENSNVEGALGASGVFAEVVNTIADAFTIQQPFGEISNASTALEQLSTETMLGLSAEFPGRPSDLTREKIENLTIKPAEITQGAQKALNKAEGMVGIINQSLAAAKAVLDGGSGPTQIAAAQESVAMLTPLLGKYQLLAAKLQPDAPKGDNGVKLRPGVEELVKEYASE